MYDQFRAIPTWIKEKGELRDKIIKFLSGYRCQEVLRSKEYPKLNGTGIFHNWDYEISVVPEDKLGLLKMYREGSRFFRYV
jgi:hypothetical protein